MKNVRLTKLGGKSALLITSLLLTPFYGYSEKSNVIPEKNLNRKFFLNNNLISDLSFLWFLSEYSPTSTVITTDNTIINPQNPGE